MSLTNEEKLELRDMPVVTVEQIVRFREAAIAIEEKYQAQIAMLRSAIANGEDVVINNYSNRAIPLEVALTVLTNTQATADAFIAEVKAGANKDAERYKWLRKKAIEKFGASFWLFAYNGPVPEEKFDELIDAELRNQDKQPCTCDGRCDGFCLEGKDRVK